ncbi:hypothetical protein BDV23DRAFT_146955 [Aspergillus alliaceus]|uniref:Uncharacterized protein n=1 Tax=Petromyces alliaceus TaxID=209559 RepID=A0A5N7CKE8_PETAA|nr:hypothetical protein BDV23DRAFT_146955 [Aspergillus alliaceus]
MRQCSSLSHAHSPDYQSTTMNLTGSLLTFLTIAFHVYRIHDPGIIVKKCVCSRTRTNVLSPSRDPLRIANFMEAMETDRQKLVPELIERRVQQMANI